MDELRELQERVARLERERLQWRLGAVAAVAALFAVAFTHASQVIDEVRTRQLVIVDQYGKIRARLGCAPNGSVGLSLWDAEGKVRAGLGLLSDGSPHLSLADAKGKLRAALAVLPDEGPSLSLLDANGKVRAVLGACTLETKVIGVEERRPESSLVLFDRDGWVVWKAP